MKKRELIIEQAIKLFVKQGFENTPTAQITKEAKVASGTLFYHFNSKEELINEAFIDIKQGLITYTNKEFNPKEDFKHALKRFWYNYLNWALENKEYNTFMTKFRNSKYISNPKKEEGKSLFGKYKSIFEAEEKKGTLKPLSYEVFGNIIFSLHQVFVAEFSNSKKVNEKKIEDSFKVLWDAIKK